MNDKKEFFATVIRSGSKNVSCKLDLTKIEVNALLKGKFYKSKQNAVVGDRLILTPMNPDSNSSSNSSTKDYLIKEILPRKNEINRIIVRERKKRTIACNCDYLIITVSVSKPSFKRGIIDRFLIRSIQWGIPAIVIFNKMDEWTKEDSPDLLFEQNRLKKLDVLCFEVSALNKSKYKNKFLKNNLDDLQETLKNKTVIFLGQSGVGKSHLISTLANQDFLLLSAKISLDGKGKHTTTWCEKVDLDKFSFIDSPGIRSFAIDDLIKDEFIHYWPDLEELGFQCKFKDCLHKEGTKGCNIQLNYKNDLIVMSRLQSYHDMYTEVSRSEFWQKNYK